jgi:L-alanine-DL-glutamate epimerase-like enolase superfamily enzyme
LRICRIDCSRHRIALDPALLATWDPQPRAVFEIDLVRVEAEDGSVGVGSGDPMPGLEQQTSLFLGEDALDLERHHRIVDNLSFHYARYWPLEVALWDLAGKLRNEPCWRMLGGQSGRVPVYASSATRREPSQCAELAKRALDAGFPALKLRFHHDDWRRDVAGVEAARAAVGDGIELLVDCNQAWRMPWDASEPRSFEQARELARALEPPGVRWIEEPLHRGNLEGLRRLRDATSIAIAGGEMTRELHELVGLIEAGCYDVLQPDVVLTGGFTGLARIAALARERGVDFTPHTWGNGIGLRANAHLFAGVAGSPWLELPFDPPQWTPERRDFAMTAPLLAEAGGIELGDAPGLGVELDEERLAGTRVDR